MPESNPGPDPEPFPEPFLFVGGGGSGGEDGGGGCSFVEFSLSLSLPLSLSLLLSVDTEFKRYWPLGIRPISLWRSWFHPEGSSLQMAAILSWIIPERMLTFPRSSSTAMKQVHFDRSKYAHEILSSSRRMPWSEACS